MLWTPALPAGPFDLAYLDPPWRWKTRTPAGDGKAPPYGRHDLSALKTFPLPDLLAKDAMVALWVIDSHLWIARELCQHWGLKFSTVGFYWVKTTVHGKWAVGTGKMTLSNPEQCWLLRRGKGLPRRGTDVRRLVVSQRREHSRKPDEVRTGLERLFGKVRRVELFARETAPEWTPWGNEC